MSKWTSPTQVSCTVGPTTVTPGASGNTASRSASSAGALWIGSGGARIRPRSRRAAGAQRVDVDAPVEREQPADAGQREPEADLDGREGGLHRDEQRIPAAGQVGVEQPETGDRNVAGVQVDDPAVAAGNGVVAEEAAAVDDVGVHSEPDAGGRREVEADVHRAEDARRRGLEDP